MNKVEHNKKRLIAALEKTLGVVTSACKQCEVSRTNFYNYYNQDKGFKEQVDSIQDIAVDFAESQLFKKIKDGSDTAIIFFLKTKGKGRGYIERQEFDHTTKGKSINSPKLNYSKLSDSELRAIANAMEGGDED